jgi:hypothetical protein
MLGKRKMTDIDGQCDSKGRFLMIQGEWNSKIR